MRPPSQIGSLRVTAAVEVLGEFDDGSPLLIQDFHQQGIGIDRRSYPPLLLRTKAKDRQVQVRRIRRGVAGRANIAKNITFMYGHSFPDS